MITLQDLYDRCGQSPWIDNLRRDWLHNGHLAGLLEQGIRGVTSNPTILAKAIQGEADYDDQFRTLIGQADTEHIYWDLVVADIAEALGLLRPLYDQSGGGDGFVSLEVSPRLANETEATVRHARELHERLQRPNLLVKVPATEAGVPAIRQLVSEGRSINVTLIFSLDRYQEVMDAYLEGLEAYRAAGASDLSEVHSVASFFVSRVDTEVDRRLEQLAGGPDGDKTILALRGRAAVAQAQTAYQQFRQTFSGPRWKALAEAGARVQRPLWASTSTKNPAYSDLLYVDSLVGPDTVNTMPDQTIEAFLHHGTVARTVDADPAGAEAVLARLDEMGVDLADVATTLETEGVASFAKSFEEVLQALDARASDLAS